MENYFPCSRFSSIKRGFCLPFSTNSPSYFTRRASIFVGPEGDITSLMGNMECLVPFPHQGLRKWHFPEYPHYTVCFFPMTSWECHGQQVRWCEKRRITYERVLFHLLGRLSCARSFSVDCRQSMAQVSLEIMFFFLLLSL